MAHTPEPWVVTDDPESDPDVPSQSIYTDFGNGTEAEIAGRICEPDNAARIVACVNALAGFPDPDKVVETLRECVAALHASNPEAVRADVRARAIETLGSGAK